MYFGLKDYEIFKSYMGAHMVMLTYGGDMFGWRTIQWICHRIYTIDMAFKLCVGYMI
jgi:hypothetical protein